MIDLKDAACRNYNPRFWDTKTRDGRTTRRGHIIIDGLRMPIAKQQFFAKRVCESCPVQAACLMAGLTEEEGIWGGKLPDERLTP